MLEQTGLKVSSLYIAQIRKPSPGIMNLEFGTVQKVAVIYEWINASGDKQDYILNLDYSRVA